MEVDDLACTFTGWVVKRRWSLVRSAVSLTTVCATVVSRLTIRAVSASETRVQNQRLKALGSGDL